MRIFALETNIEKIKRPFLSEEESEIATVYFHGFRFFLVLASDAFFSALLISAGIAFYFMNMPLSWILIAGILVWFVFIFIPLLKAYLDWRFDFLLVTTDKVVIVDQSSPFRP